jgi:uncharacterized protein
MLLDTSGLMCIHNRTEPSHADAVRCLNAATRWLTHSYVLAEFVALATTRRMTRAAAFQFLGEIQRSERAEVVYVDQVLHEAAFRLLEQRLDKTWSLCDAVSFVLLEQRQLGEALTTDHHFEQAGFVRLLKP